LRIARENIKYEQHRILREKKARPMMNVIGFFGGFEEGKAS
jgi:hypothetical protein